jgi:hypothetical protein
MEERELILRTAPRQRVVIRATAQGVVLETQSVLHDSCAHGWATVLQHHLDREQIEQIRGFLDSLPTADRDTAETWT